MCKTAATHCFSRQNRLLTSKDFESVFARPVKSSDAYFTVLARPQNLPNPRLGIIVSKKNVRTAVARNRIKRLVRESFRTHKYMIEAFDVVVICKQRCAGTINSKLSQKLQHHWKSLKIHAE